MPLVKLSRPASRLAVRRVNAAASSRNSALIVIDLQTDYVSGGDLVAGQASPLLTAFPELPRNVSRALASARARDTPVVHVRERDSAADSAWLPWWEALHGRGVGAGSHCVAEPWAAEEGDEPVFVKHAYDAFSSGDVSDRLVAHLRALRTERLYFAGALTKACVMFSAHTAFSLGFEVFVLSDCCADRSREHHDAVLSVYDGYHIRVVESSEAFPAS